MKNFFKTAWMILLVVMLLLSSVGVGAVHIIDHPPGEEDGGGADIGLDNPLGEIDSIAKLIEKILEVVVAIGIPIAILFIIYSGFLFVTAQGNEEKLKTAKKTLAWTLVGTAILLGAWLLVDVIEGTVNQFR